MENIRWIADNLPDSWEHVARSALAWVSSRLES